MRPPSLRLWQAYALSIAALVTLVLVVSGFAQLWLIQRETRVAVEARQALEAARAFYNSPDLAAGMQAAGVIEAPHFLFLNKK